MLLCIRMGAKFGTIFAILTVVCSQSFEANVKQVFMSDELGENTCPCESVTSLQKTIEELIDKSEQHTAESLHRDGIIEDIQTELWMLRHEIEEGTESGGDNHSQVIIEHDYETTTMPMSQSTADVDDEFDLNKMTLAEIAHFARGVHEDLKELKSRQLSLAEDMEAMHEKLAHATDPHQHVVRLVGASNANEGRVEVLHNGVWSTVCDDNWGYNDAMVVCNQLGFHFGGVPIVNGKYGEGTGPILLDDVHCFGNESSIVDCPHSGLLINNCGHNEDAGVQCNREGSVRLADGASYDRGRVEILHNGKWGTICDDSWGNDDATVVCRELGFSTGEAKDGAYFGQGIGAVFLDEVDCDGHERMLIDCDSTTFGKHNCDHSEDAGVICS